MITRMVTCWLLCAGFAAPLRGDTPLSSLADVRGMTRSEAAEFPQVRVRGTVTLIWTQARSAWVVQDESAGFWVSFDTALQRELWQGGDDEVDALVLGGIVEIEGTVIPGGFAPVLAPHRITHLGPGVLPPAVPITPEALLGGGHESRRMSATGVVIGCETTDRSQLLRLDSPNGGFLAEVVSVPPLAPERLIGAEVNVQGVAGSTFNSRAEFVSLRMLVSGGENVRIIEPAPTDPFDVPKVGLGELAMFSPKGRQIQRRKVEGVVSFCQPGSHFYLQDGQSAIRVATTAPDVLKPGDRVEASGFVDRRKPVAGMTNAAIRKLGEGAAPQALPVDWELLQRLIEPMVSGLGVAGHDYDGWLVHTTARLVDVHRLPGGGTRLLLSSGGNGDFAMLPPVANTSDRQRLDDLRPGSVLRVTGVAELEYSGLPGRSDEVSLPVRLGLQLRGFEDIEVLQRASWWTTRRLMWTLGICSLVIFAGASWIILLHRMVALQSQRLESAIRTHRDSELEMKGAREERYRLAGDLHDGLQQHLTGASYRLEAALMRLGEVPEGVQEQFAATRAALERTRTGLRECLLGLRSVEEGPAGFSELLHHAAENMEHWPEGAVEIVSSGAAFSLSRHVMGTLLLFMQEAVANALKHGAATHVRVSLDYLTDGLEMTVEDNGSGFDPAQAPDSSGGHFGLESMRHRLRWLGGAIELNSRPGEGTRIIARLARAKIEAANPGPAELEEVS
jgi:signal transduction histidine kinase